MHFRPLSEGEQRRRCSSRHTSDNRTAHDNHDTPVVMRIALDEIIVEESALGTGGFVLVICGDKTRLFADNHREHALPAFNFRHLKEFEENQKDSALFLRLAYRPGKLSTAWLSASVLE